MKFSKFIYIVNSISEATGQTTVQHLLPRCVFSNEISTMATNSKNIFINPNFLDKLTPNQIFGVLLHEAFHDLLQHSRLSQDPTSWAYYDASSGVSSRKWHELCNIAMDITINEWIVSLGYELTEGACFRKTFDIPNDIVLTEDIFNYLLEQYKSSQPDERLIQTIEQVILDMAKEIADQEKVKNKSSQTPSDNGYPEGSPEAGDEDGDDDADSGTSSSAAGQQGNKNESNDTDSQDDDASTGDTDGGSSSDDAGRGSSSDSDDSDDDIEEDASSDSSSDNAGNSDSSQDGDNDGKNSESSNSSNSESNNADSGSTKDISDDDDLGDSDISGSDSNIPEGASDDMAKIPESAIADNRSLRDIFKDVVDTKVLTTIKQSAERRITTPQHHVEDTWIDRIFEYAGRYLVRTAQVIRTYSRPSHRGSISAPGSDLSYPVKGRLPGKSVPKVTFYVDCSGSMGNLPKGIFQALRQKQYLITRAHCEVFPFASRLPSNPIDLNLPIDLDDIEANLDSGTNLYGYGKDIGVIPHINSRLHYGDISCIITDSDTTVDIDTVNPDVFLIVVTNQPHKVVGEQNSKHVIIPVSSFALPT